LVFIGREYELDTLNSLYQTGAFQLVIIYGRRRVGKTTLISKFAEDKNALFFPAQECSDKINLERFSSLAQTHFEGEGLFTSLHNWEAAFNYIANKSGEKQTLLIIDEFPYLVHENPSIMSILQHAIDHKLKDSRIFIILCGSYMSFMEHEVMGYKSPLYGRRTAQLKIEEFDYLDSSGFIQGYLNSEKLKSYAVFGGIPHYLAKLNSESNFEDNVLRNILDRSAYLYDEPLILLKQELREPSMYNSIIQAIANGASRLNEIATKVGEDNQKCSKYLLSLMALGFIKKETPFGTLPDSRKTIYKIEDLFLRFWYRFVFPNKALIETGMARTVFSKKILPEMGTYLGRVFEDVCIQFLWRKNKSGELPFIFENIGRWWGTDNRTHSQSEIDIVAGTKREAIFGECKYKNEPIGTDVLDSLKFKAGLFTHTEKYFALFSKSGFTDELIKASNRDKNILLFGLDDLYRL
jgi:AAA+ ATPase superfamily predicted ATPase